jgi:hypothetical protein
MYQSKTMRYDIRRIPNNTKYYVSGTYEFTWSFEPYVEFVPYSTRVLGSKGWAVGRGIGPLPYRPPDRRLPIVGRPPPGTRALDTLSAQGVCRGFGRFALCDEHWAHFWRPRYCNICYYGVRSRSTSNKSNKSINKP